MQPWFAVKQTQAKHVAQSSSELKVDRRPGGGTELSPQQASQTTR